MKLFYLFICLFVFAAAPALAEEANSGFGAPFADVPLPGFSDPVTDAEAAAGIEPAAGTEEEGESADGQADAPAAAEPEEFPASFEATE